MDYFIAIVKLLSGLGVFLIGFKLLSENIEKLANSGLKKLFKKTSNNRFIGVGIGALVTAIIQSSSAATIMIVGFVNAGVMDLFQATAMIMGANIGTTITAQIVSLNAIPVAEVLMIFSFVGLFGNMLAKRDKTKTIFMSLAGLGMVFLALSFMSDSMNIFKESQVFLDVLSSVNNPFLLLLIGMVATAILQSSSAVTTIIISMLMAGLVIGDSNSNAVLYVILGTNIGTCVTALISSIGANANAKRASLIHLMFNVFGALIFFIVLLCWPSFMQMTFRRWFPNLPGTQIAMFHTAFNVIVTILFLPLINVFVKISKLIIPDKKNAVIKTYLDNRFLKTPAIAIQQTANESLRLGKMAIDTLNLSIEGFVNKSLDAENQIRDNILNIEQMNEAILKYVLKISSLEISDDDEAYIASIHHIIIDFTREAEIADNIIKYTKKAINENLTFTEAVNEGVIKLKYKLNQQFAIVNKLYQDLNDEFIKESDTLENEIDNLRSVLIDDHIKRLEDGKCSPSSNSLFINLISNLERAGDHLNYIAHHLAKE